MSKLDKREVRKGYQALAVRTGAPLAAPQIADHPAPFTEQDVVDYYHDLELFETHLAGQPREISYEIYQAFQISLLTPQLKDLALPLFHECFGVRPAEDQESQDAGSQELSVAPSLPSLDGDTLSPEAIPEDIEMPPAPESAS